MMKLSKIGGIIFLLLIVIAIIPIFIPDEEYTVGAKQWLDDSNNPEVVPDELNRFNALVGFYVEEGKNIVSEGAAIIKEENARLENIYDSTQTLPQNDYWNNPPKQVSGKLLKIAADIFKGNPVKWLSDNLIEYETLLSDNQVFLNRFRQLMSMMQYSRYLKLDLVNGVNINYSGFIATKRLNTLTIIDEFINGKKDVAVKRLLKNIEFSRLMMSQSFDILEKLIAVEMFKIDLKTYSLLLDIKKGNELFKDFNIPNLVDEESSMLNAYKGEFASLSTLLYKKAAGEATDFEDIIMRYYYKPRKIENNQYKYVWQFTLAQQEMTLAGRDRLVKSKLEQIATSNKSHISLWDLYKDPIGSILFDTEIPSSFGYAKYIARIDHLDATITLVNTKNAIYSKRIPLGDIADFVNSVDGNINAGYVGAKITWDSENEELSFAIPDYSTDSIPRQKISTSYIN